MITSRFACVAALGCALFTAAAGAGPEHGAIPPAKIEITAQSHDQIVADIVQSARTKWTAAGLNAELSDKLAEDLRVVIRSYLKDDFDSLHRLWTERGATLGEWAGAGAARELDSGRYNEADVARLKRSTTEDQVRYLWMHPSERGVRWEKIGSDHVVAGTEILVAPGSRDWPTNGMMGMGSRWRSPADAAAQAEWAKSNPAPRAPEGFVHLESAESRPPPKPGSVWISLQNKAMDGAIPAAFVQFPVKMQHGPTILWRMSFAYDRERAAWYPLDLSCSIPEGVQVHPLY